MRIMIVGVSLVTLFAVYHIGITYHYKDSFVIDYQSMKKKAEYGSITFEEWLIGAQDLVLKSCKFHCLRALVDNKERCVVEAKENYDPKTINNHTAHELARRFKVCIY